MANTIATCIGRDRSRTKEDHRLGSESATGQANTNKTFTTCHVNKDGSGYVQVLRKKRDKYGANRDTVVLHTFDFGPEEED